MNTKRILVVLATACLAAGLPCLAAAAEPPAAEQPAGMWPPQPGPEHQHLLKAVGKWKAVQTMHMPGQAAQTFEGVEDNTSMGGLWIISHYTVSGAMSFEGHGIFGYDTVQKKYAGVWADTWSTSYSTMESTVDPTGKIIDSTGKGIGPDGKPSIFSMREEWQDDDHRNWKMYDGPKPEGQPMMEITYTRMK